MDRTYWFNRKNKKFLHNIDTFYFSVKLADDLTADSEQPEVIELRQYCDNYRNGSDDIPYIDIPYDYALQYTSFSYAGFYNFCISCPDKFDFFLAPIVPRNVEATCGSVTSEIIVQIRAEMLWEMGATLAYRKCMDFVRSFCNKFNLTIQEVKENRVDFAWHTNALQDPENYFRIDRFAPMQVSRFKRVNYSYELYGTDFENDYINLGKRGDKCFIRIYLKTKEVVQKGYKGFFLKLWLFQGLISRYDFYCLDKAYMERNWNYCDIARLQFKLEYDSEDLTADQVDEIRQLICPEQAQYNYPAIRELADKYTPRITKVLNVEFQTMRKMTKSFNLFPLKKNDGVESRVLDFLDNRKIITDYLTDKTFRLIDPKVDSNRSRCPMNDFWTRLRNTKQVDVVINNHDLKLIRDYSSQLDMKMRKKRAMRSMSSYAMMISRSWEGDFNDDWEEIVCTMNDNDMYDLRHFKRKRFNKMKNSLPDFAYENELDQEDPTDEV